MDAGNLAEWAAVAVAAALGCYGIRVGHKARAEVKATADTQTVLAGRMADLETSRRHDELSPRVSATADESVRDVLRVTFRNDGPTMCDDFEVSIMSNANAHEQPILIGLDFGTGEGIPKFEQSGHLGRLMPGESKIVQAARRDQNHGLVTFTGVATSGELAWIVVVPCEIPPATSTFFGEWA